MQGVGRGHEIIYTIVAQYGHFGIRINMTFGNYIIEFCSFNWTVWATEK
jgi:hypothetical protein